jgi:hypothetical protein
VGSIALLLQDEGLPVTAVEVVPEAVEIMRSRGVHDARMGRLEDLDEERAFDTILLLMNGSALAGTLRGLPPFLSSLGRLLAPGGQVLLDSTDLTGGRVGGPWLDEDGSLPDACEDDYPGELQYQIEYRRDRGAPFPQLFVDPETLRRVAEREGWTAEVVWEGVQGEYLARLGRS